MQKDREKEHKKIVKFIRNINAQLANDEYIGLNRFKIVMLSEEMYRFSDGSGIELYFIFKLIDEYTNNSACFLADSFNYKRKIFTYANDFLIRCSDGWRGHIPSLHYAAYDIHTTMPYVGRKRIRKEPEEGVINKYNFLRWDVFGCNDV